MCLSKLQKLDPSAIDKCSMVFVPPLACEKEELRRFVNTIAQFTNARSIYSGFYQWRMIDDNQKKLFLHLAIDNDFFHSAFVNRCMM
jgi:hypothetical protein